MFQTSLAIVGATGAVGREVLSVCERLNFPVRVRLLASPRSAGATLPYRGQYIPVEPLSREGLRDVDLAIFSAGSDVSREWAPIAVEEDVTVIDNSSAFRGDPDVPLVVPEINGDDVHKHKGIIAVPNCTTIIALMALFPLHRAFGGTEQVVASSYQAVSGAGNRGLHEYESQLLGTVQKSIFNTGTITPEVFPHPILGNVIPSIGNAEGRDTTEELKFWSEGSKIMGYSTWSADMTCVRVPVPRVHSVSVSASFKEPIKDLARVYKAWGSFSGLEMDDDLPEQRYPMPYQLSGQFHCAVGRARLSRALPGGVSFFVCGDQLLKGAALNAVQIARRLVFS